MRYPAVSLFIISLPVFGPSLAFAQNCPQNTAASLIALQGTVLIATNGNTNSHQAKLNDRICQGDTVTISPNSRASLELPGNQILSLKEQTQITLAELNINTASIIKIAKGFLNFISRKPKEIKIESGITNAMPLGTEFAFNVDDHSASVWVYEGKVKVYNPHGSVVIVPGNQFAQVQKGKAPQVQLDIHPQDAVNWALYYPPLLAYPASTTAVDSDIQLAVDAYRHGQVAEALSRLDNLPAAKQTAYFHKIRGAMRLSIGQDELALADINALLANNPADAEALALQSVRALSQNRKDEAYALANKAITANPHSAVAYSALSFTEQGHFKLDNALAAAQHASKLAAHDAFVWARKAELELALSLTSASEKSAQRALSLDANLERTQTVMGFSHLTHMATDEALHSFQRAIQLDSNAPLPRLGLGLAKIRDGNLEAGRKDLEIAALLDPNNSLIRSYLGKAYYEENRNNLAGEQLNLAKARDPKDPTPYFYDALKKQTENRPVEALRDLQTAMELNDNRAVYRSKQLLDSDRAARGASLARIYDTLGFEQRGILEASTSLADDPTNYSAHRFLSDSYIRFPARGAAQTSELLQAQLLQPININPIQPHLAISNRSMPIGLGVSEPLFRDFTRVFERNRPQLTISGLYGNLDTAGNEAVLSGIYNNLSYSFGQFHFTTDGFRKNADINHDIYNAFVQAAVTDNLNVQFEYLHRETTQGNLIQDLQPGQDYTESFSLNQNKIRGGVHLKPTTNIDFIGVISYLEGSDKILANDGTSDPNFDKSNRSILSGESQLIWKTNHLDLLLGGGAYERRNLGLSHEFGEDEPKSLIVNESNTFYGYSYLKLPYNFLATLGFKYSYLNTIDSAANSNEPFNQWQPKLGIQWSPLKFVTFRFAYSESIKASLFADQTIEPTQISGFNQLFDDFNGDLSSLSAAAIDFNWPDTIYAGLQFTRRDIDKIDITERNAQVKSLRQADNYKGYLYWMFNSNFTLNVEYQVEKDSLIDPASYDLTTIKLPVSLRYFNACGAFAQLGITYVSQKQSPNDRTAINSFSEAFVLADSSIGYRFPNRLGMVSLEVRNIFDTHFIYNDKWRIEQADIFQMSRQQEFLPSRTFVAKILFNF